MSDDDSTLVVTAAGSDKLVTIDAASGEVLGRVDVDAVPRGIALVSDTAGRPEEAWVLNAVENTVSLVDVTATKAPKLSARIVLHDPTNPVLKQGRKAFETAEASATGTFACASCHPDGHTDQLLWVLNTPIVTGGDQIQPRTTMPIRGCVIRNRSIGMGFPVTLTADTMQQTLTAMLPPTVISTTQRPLRVI